MVSDSELFRHRAPVDTDALLVAQGADGHDEWHRGHSMHSWSHAAGAPATAHLAGVTGVNRQKGPCAMTHTDRIADLGSTGQE
jgi:hypothetical protein